MTTTTSTVPAVEALHYPRWIRVGDELAEPEGYLIVCRACCTNVDGQHEDCAVWHAAHELVEQPGKSPTQPWCATIHAFRDGCPHWWDAPADVSTGLACQACATRGAAS